MTSKDIIAHLKHVDFPTQQRRLRHLRSVAARNLTVAKCFQAQGGIAALSTYFTLHKDEESSAFYQSEVILGSLNPTWRSFSINHLESDFLDASSTSVVVRVWQKMTGQEPIVTILWEIHLSGLIYLGDKLQRDDLWHSGNTLIVGLRDGFYGCPHEDELVNGRAYTVDSAMVEQVMIKQSYHTHTLDRIQTVLRAIQQTRASVNRVKYSIGNQLAYCQSVQKKKAKRELSVLRVNKMRCDLEWRTMKLQSQKENYELKQTANYQRDVSIENSSEKLEKDLSRLHEKKKAYFDIREGHIKTGAQLVMRRKQLISELSCIYPIKEHQDNTFRICGVKLPNSEDFSGQDEIMIGVSLSFTCHLVQMISQFLDVPLRYPMEHRGSRSLIHDHIIDKLSEKERDFPLYSKGKEKFQFQYGVYLLNKNIAQMRYYCGLGTSDLRLTLANLKSLLELRLGVRFEQTGSPEGNIYVSHSIHPVSNKTSHHSSHQTPEERGHKQSSSSSPTPPTSSQPQNSLCLTPTTKIGSTDTQDHEPSTSPPSSRPQDINPHLTPTTKVGLTDTQVHEPTENLDLGQSKGQLTKTNNSILESKQVSCVKEERDKQKASGGCYDMEASSSEDSVCAVYGASFKQWPRASASPNETLHDSILISATCAISNQTPSSPSSLLEHQASELPDSSNGEAEYPRSTFKTKAMCLAKDDDDDFVDNQSDTNFTHVQYGHSSDRRESSTSSDLATFSAPYLLDKDVDSDKHSGDILISDS